MKLSQWLCIVFLTMCPLIATSFLTGCASTPRQEGTGEVVDSSAVTVSIKTQLLADPEISSLGVSVKTYKGVVTLAGHVDTTRQKQKVLDIVRNTNGVKAIKDRLTVR
jgi:osmotically-inducible protein OsmY